MNKCCCFSSSSGGMTISAWFGNLDSWIPTFTLKQYSCHFTWNEFCLSFMCLLFPVCLLSYDSHDSFCIKKLEFKWKCWFHNICNCVWYALKSAHNFGIVHRPTFWSNQQLSNCPQKWQFSQGSCISEVAMQLWLWNGQNKVDLEHDLLFWCCMRMFVETIKDLLICTKIRCEV